MSLRNKNPSILPEPVLRSWENGSIPVSRLGNESLVTWKSWILTGNAELGPDAHFTMSGHVADLIHFPPWTISQSCQVWWIEREIHFPSGSRNLATFSEKTASRGSVGGRRVSFISALKWCHIIYRVHESCVFDQVLDPPLERHLCSLFIIQQWNHNAYKSMRALSQETQHGGTVRAQSSSREDYHFSYHGTHLKCVWTVF